MRSTVQQVAARAPNKALTHISSVMRFRSCMSASDRHSGRGPGMLAVDCQRNEAGCYENAAATLLSKERDILHEACYAKLCYAILESVV